MLKDTIISAFNYDGTLLKWLKKVEDALQNASASEFRVNKKGNATISFSIVFANGDTLESGDIILQQGESVTGATIRQGHLILTLSNGNELDAGDVGAVTGFSINASQHLIVTYQNGTTQDLGAIFSGNVTINGDLSVSNNIRDLSKIVDSQGRNRFVEDNLTNTTLEGITISYSKWSLSGTHLMLVVAGSILNGTVIPQWQILARATMPTWIANKIYPILQTTVSYLTMTIRNTNNTTTNALMQLIKLDNNLSVQFINGLTATSDGNFRIQIDLIIDTD